MKKYISGIIGGLVFAAIVIWVIFYTVNNKRNNDVFSKKNTNNVEAQAIIDKNLDRFYPSTVRETVKLYQRIITCLYSSTYTEDEYYQIVDQLRILFDDKLLELNPRDGYITDLYDEIAVFKASGKVVSLTNIQLESQSEKYTIDGENYASIVSLFVVRGKEGISKTYEKFILHEDKDGHWKIMGWEKTEPVDLD